MTQFKRGNKLDIETILVSGANVAFAKGVAFVHPTDPKWNITDGQLGVLSADFQGTIAANNFITAATTATDVSTVRIIQGTPASENMALVDQWELDDPGFVATNVMRKDAVRSVEINKPRSAVYSATAVVDIAAPLDSSDYGIIAELESVQMDKTYGSNSNVVTTQFLTPEYSALTFVDDKDHFLQSLLYKFNRNSFAFSGESGNYAGKDPVIGLGINIAGGAGTPIGAIVVGDSVPFITAKGVTSSVMITPEMVAGLAKLMALQAADVASGASTEAIVALSTIEVIDLSTAGAAAKVNAFIILGERDSIPRGVNTSPYYTVDVTVNLTDAFRVTSGFTMTKASNEEGKNLRWDLANRRRAQRLKHNLYSNTDYASFSIEEGYNYVADNTVYSAMIIDYLDFENTLTTTEYNPKQATVLFPAIMDFANTITTVLAAYTANPDNLFVVTTGNALATSDVTGILLPWLVSAGAKVRGSL